MKSPGYNSGTRMVKCHLWGVEAKHLPVLADQMVPVHPKSLGQDILGEVLFPSCQLNILDNEMSCWNARSRSPCLCLASSLGYFHFLHVTVKHTVVVVVEWLTKIVISNVRERVNVPTSGEVFAVWTVRFVTARNSTITQREFVYLNNPVL